MIILTLCWSSLIIWGFSLIINLRLFVNPLFRAALLFEIGALLGFFYLFYQASNNMINPVELKMLLVASAGVSLSRLFHVYDRIFRAEQFVLQNKSIASLLFLLRTKVKPENIESNFDIKDMVVFSMYKRHAEREGLGTHHMAFTKDNGNHVIDLKTAY